MKGLCELFIEALDDFTVKLLIVAASVALVLEESLDSDKRATAWIDSFGIFMAVLVIGSVTSVNNY